MRLIGILVLLVLALWGLCNDGSEPGAVSAAPAGPQAEAPARSGSTEGDAPVTERLRTRSGPLSPGLQEEQPATTQIAVRVVERPGGSPIPDAEVGFGIGTTWLTGTTAADGVVHFEVPATTASNAGRITAHANGFEPADGQPMAKENGQLISEHVVRMTRGSGVHGLVLRPNGEPVSGARVLVSSTTTGERWLRWTTADGRFAAACRADGPYSVLVRDGVRGAVRHTFKPVPERVLELPPLQLQRQHLLTGTLELQGRPLPGFRIHASHVSTTFFDTEQLGSSRGVTKTDEFGRFRFEGLHPGGFQISLPNLVGTEEQQTIVTTEVDGPPLRLNLSGSLLQLDGEAFGLLQRHMLGTSLSLRGDKESINTDWRACVRDGLLLPSTIQLSDILVHTKDGLFELEPLPESRDATRLQVTLRESPSPASRER